MSQSRLTSIGVQWFEDLLIARTARDSLPSLHLAELEGIDDLAVGEGVGDDDLPASGLAPGPGLEGVEGVLDRLLGIVGKFHQERLDTPGQQELTEDGLDVGEGVDRDTTGDRKSVV